MMKNTYFVRQLCLVKKSLNLGDRHPERQIRISGTATTDILMETVPPDGLWDWIAE